MTIPTPDDFLAYWLDIDARVDDEVTRVMSFLNERKPGTSIASNFGTSGPYYQKKGSLYFCLVFDDADVAFLEKVAQRFRDRSWEATVEENEATARKSHVLKLTSPTLKASLPHGPIEVGLFA